MGVKIARVELKRPTQNISAIGRLAYAEDKILHIHPRIEGWVEQLFVRSEAEYVEAGTALYSLYSPTLVNAQEEMLIALAQNNRSLITAAEARLKTLDVPQNFISQLRKTREIQREVVFYAPQSGVIKMLNIQQGFYVSPRDTLLSIAPIDQIWALVDVFAKDAHAIELGQTLTVSSEYLPGTILNSQIDYISCA